jgi:alcohol dehydrogenase class IV
MLTRQSESTVCPCKEPQVLIGPGAVSNLSSLVSSVMGMPAERIRALLVVGGGFKNRRWRDRALSGAHALQLSECLHGGLPTPASVAECSRRAQAAHAQVVVAVGGGSVMDAAKAIANVISYPAVGPETVVRCCLGQQAPPPHPAHLPVIAVPTTPGTGAEATPFATVWDFESGRKLSLRSGHAPVAAVLDPDLLAGLPGTVLASSALDTLAHGMEATWSINSSSLSLPFGLAAVTQLSGLLDEVLRPQPTMATRLGLLQAGHHAGRAIAIAETTACHAVSYPLTLRYELAHGHACGVTLSRMLLYNAATSVTDCVDPRGPRHVRRTLDLLLEAFALPDAGAVARRIDGFIRGAGLSAYENLDVDHDAVATEAIGYARCHNNPRFLDRHTLKRLLSAPGSVRRESPR